MTLGNEIELQEDKGDPGLLSESVSFLQDKDHSMETRVSPLSTLSSETESEKQEDVCCCFQSLDPINSLQPRGLQHARLPHPSLSSGICSN